MPRQTKDRDTTWELNGDNRTWIVTANATIETEGESAIYDDGSGSRIRILGSASSDTISCIRMGDDRPSLLIGQQGSVTSRDSSAIVVWRGGRIENHGIVAADEYGISKEFNQVSFAVSNTGTIDGALAAIIHVGGNFSLDNRGIVSGGEKSIDLTANQSVITNLKDGEIVADAVAIDYRLGGEHSLDNKGLIFGGDVAIAAQVGTTVRIHNTGIIAGDINLGNGADRIDTRGGIVRGTIRGGEGDDVYLISSGHTNIIDTGGSFGDSVRSTARFTLSGGLDNLTLLGGKNIYGNGNNGANIIRGNDGDNTLSAAAGEDFLSGGRGRDRLEGGAGADTFEFRKGFDVDHILDFTDGEDHLLGQDVKRQQQFDRLDIRQVGDDTVINFGGGDRLILEDVMKSAIDFSDFNQL